jgi:hypothetical protein
VGLLAHTRGKRRLDRQPQAKHRGGLDDVPPTRDTRELIWQDVERELINRDRAEELLRELGDQEQSTEEAES